METDTTAFHFNDARRLWHFIFVTWSTLRGPFDRYVSVIRSSSRLSVANVVPPLNESIRDITSCDSTMFVRLFFSSVEDLVSDTKAKARDWWKACALDVGWVKCTSPAQESNEDDLASPIL